MAITPFASVRPYAPDDAAAVLGLIAADALPGQPPTTPAMLAEALAGRSPVDGGWWGEQATVGHPVAGVGVLWWIGVIPTARGRGLGRALLGHALDLLARLGAHKAVLYVDDDAPPGDPERDRTAANALYDRAGFTEVDRLHSFTRHRQPSRR
ncbi:GNAT family N-acetyltransferase [Streptomyces sp. NPDC021098]|uniref:GNAT family N-acetyltransferase n=1 Tax=unclassified Streptomyces TaxID=2593676 RepID=UPI00379F6554